MPIDEFLAHFVKSKAAGASTMMPNVGVESGPEVVSRSPAPHYTLACVGASETTVIKDRERKRHHEGHSSKSHQNKKLKDPLNCPSSGKMDLPSDDVLEFCSPKQTNTKVSGMTAGDSLRVCKNFVDKLLSFGDATDPFEVKRLREEVRGLKKLNEELKKTSTSLANDNTASADKLFVALTEKFEFITECDALSGQVKDLKMKIQDLEEAVKISDGNLVKGVGAWSTEQAKLVEKIDNLNVQLSKCQTEAMSSFEEGYGECITRFARLGIDVKDHGFESYLADLAKKTEDGKTGSSEVAHES